MLDRLGFSLPSVGGSLIGLLFVFILYGPGPMVLSDFFMPKLLVGAGALALLAGLTGYCEGGLLKPKVPPCNLDPPPIPDIVLVLALVTDFYAGGIFYLSGFGKLPYAPCDCFI